MSEFFEKNQEEKRELEQGNLNSAHEKEACGVAEKII